MELKNVWEEFKPLFDKIKPDEQLWDAYYDIAKSIFEYRMNNKLTYKKLAEKLGVSVNMVKEFESGMYDFKLSQLWMITKKLNLEFNIMFVNEGEKNEIQD